MRETLRTEPPSRKPMQIGIVVPDVEAAVRTYGDVYGIGGWQVMEIGSDGMSGETPQA